MNLKLTSKIYLLSFVICFHLSFADDNNKVTSDPCNFSKLLQQIKEQSPEVGSISLIENPISEVKLTKNLIDTDIPTFSIFLNEIENQKILSIIPKKTQ